MVDLATTERKNLRIDEVAELFEVKRRTVYYWVEKGRLVAVKIGGGCLLFPVIDLRRVLKASIVRPFDRSPQFVQSVSERHDSQ